MNGTVEDVLHIVMFGDVKRNPNKGTRYRYVSTRFVFKREKVIVSSS